MSSHPVDIHVGKRLRLRRTLLGMSQEAVGSAIGVTFQQVQKYERGINRMGASRLFDFSKVLSIPISYFFEGYQAEGEAGRTPVAGMAEDSSGFEHEVSTSRELLELTRAFHNITDPQVRKRVLELVKSLTDK